MSDRTSIEWTDTTWNPVRGCTRVSAGCARCYAERQAGRFTHRRDALTGMTVEGPFHGFVTERHDGYHWTGRVELVESKLSEPLSWRKPRRVFVNSMSDLFHESLPDEQIDRVFAVMALCPHLTFQVLTKRAERMRTYMRGPLAVERYVALLDFAAGLLPDLRMEDFGLSIEGGALVLPNLWLGVSVEDQATADERIPELLATPAALRFVSAEPLLGPVVLDGSTGGNDWLGDHYDAGEDGLDWLIVGSESGPGARPCRMDWVRALVEQCRGTAAAMFVKQVQLYACHRCGRGFERRPEAETNEVHVCCLRARRVTSHDLALFPEDLRVREFPRSVVATA